MSSVEDYKAQIADILLAWGMPAANAEITAEALTWAGLRGVDSHGISMLTEYDLRRKAGRLDLKAEPVIVHETPVSALIDGKGGMGHPAYRLAVDIAVAKAKAIGIGAVAVRNSAHYGALGHYTELAALEGLIGFGTTSVTGIVVAPTGGKEARFGTDPLSFAAPMAGGPPFVLDMATTTVAKGRIRNKSNEGQPCPPGWILDREGRPATDPDEALTGGGFLTSLGGTPENASHKGYGLATMVNILSSSLSGATLITNPMHLKQPSGLDQGHFFMAMSPALFRPQDDFEESVAELVAALRGTPPLDPARPVQVAGDPERATMTRRLKDGIEIAPGLKAKLKAIAAEAGARWRLD
jgi:LDH2 family malate/lactate/ureidoglycolate dehydrogenase